MDDRTWERCLYWLREMKQTTIVYLMLFGEPLLDKKIFDRVKDLKKMGIPVAFSTNGRLLTSEVACNLKEAGVEYISISPHTEDAREIIADIKKSAVNGISKKYPIKIVLSDGFINKPHNWAGQVDSLPANYFFDCHYIHGEECCIMSDGRITACCIDAGGSTEMGNVFDTDLLALSPKKFPLCSGCHHMA